MTYTNFLHFYERLFLIFYIFMNDFLCFHYTFMNDFCLSTFNYHFSIFNFLRSRTTPAHNTAITNIGTISSPIGVFKPG